MLNKETIIDDIDVSNCQHVDITTNLLDNKTYVKCSAFMIQKDYDYCDCSQNTNCNYKQLKRKEKLLTQAENHIKDLELMVHNGEERENDLKQKIISKEQECNSLKTKIFVLEEMLDEYKLIERKLQRAIYEELL